MAGQVIASHDGKLEERREIVEDVVRSTANGDDWSRSPSDRQLDCDE